MPSHSEQKAGFMGFALRRGSIPAVVTAAIATVAFVPGDAVTEAIILVQIFVFAIVVLAALSRFTLLAAWPRGKQTSFIWLIAVGTAVLVTLEPVFIHALRR